MTHRSSSSCHMIQISINKLRMISPTGVAVSSRPLPTSLFPHHLYGILHSYISYISFTLCISHR